MRRLTAVSLFSGAGGLDLGVEGAGYRVFYPASEQSTNNTNWAAAVAANGGGTLYDKPVWWATVTP